jgi:hypothetical protein
MTPTRHLHRLAAGLLLATLTAAPAAAAVPPPVPSASPVTAGVASQAAGAPAAAAARAVPVFAFYYSWFDTSSWRRAKTDYPLLGRYTSDDPAVLRQHVRWAKQAGIDGFIVSWKDTPTNDRRLSLLMQVAHSENFRLAMIYQGLDFDRVPLPVDRVAADLRYFDTTYAQDPVFARLGGKALTIWSGTWAYSHDDVARVVAPVHDSMLVLNTEKSLKGYQRLADVTDGDAYYWSSVNPATNANYAGKLTELSRAIHADGKYWIAPFAPGFDARKVGGSMTVERRDGATLRTEYGTALASSPDLLGLISWNEFSENSYVEPSVKYGRRYLDVLADLRQAVPATPRAAVDSSEPGGGSGLPFGLGNGSRTWAMLGTLVLFFGGIAALRPLVRRRDEELGLLARTDARPALPGGSPPPAGDHPPGLPTRPAFPPSRPIAPVDDGDRSLVSPHSQHSTPSTS